MCESREQIGNKLVQRNFRANYLNQAIELACGSIRAPIALQQDGEGSQVLVVPLIGAHQSLSPSPSLSITFITAVARFPIPPLIATTGVVTSTLRPSSRPTTFTLNVQEALGAMVPPSRLMVDEPAYAVILPPPQDPVSPSGLDIFSPEGRKSPNARPFRAVVALGLLTVKLSFVVWRSLMLAAPKASEIWGGPITVTVAVLLVAPGPLCVEEMGPVVLF